MLFSFQDIVTLVLKFVFMYISSVSFHSFNVFILIFEHDVEEFVIMNFTLKSIMCHIDITIITFHLET